MHKRPVRRIHQSDDAVIDIARQVGRQMRRAKALAELRDFGNRRQLSLASSEPAASAVVPALRDIDPDVAIALLAGKRRSVNLRGIERVLAGERRDLAALARHRLEAPSRDTCRSPAGHRTIRRRAECRDADRYRAWQSSLPVLGPSQHQRNTQQHGLRHLLAVRSPTRASPDTSRRTAT